MLIVGETSNNSVHQLYPGDHFIELTNELYKCVAKSFTDFRVANDAPSKDEIKHRFEICMKWAKIMKGDLKWGYARIYGRMYDALKTELSGGTYTPSTRTVWLAGE